jgi:hypothetical protein
MEAVADVSLVREQSTAPVYLVVGGVKFWITDISEFNSLGFRWDKVHVVADGSLNHLLESRLHAPPTTRATAVFFDCGNDFDGFDGRWHWNCKEGAAIASRDVLIAGWLHSDPVINKLSYGLEDIHYDVKLDARFLDRMYGFDGLSRALIDTRWPGNPPAPVSMRMSTPAPAGSQQQRGTRFSAFLLPSVEPANRLENSVLHCELNAWHVDPEGQYFGRHFVGRGTAPGSWINPLAESSNAWFPFHPLDPEGTGRQLAEGDYVIVRGTLWEDTAHDGGQNTSPWASGDTLNHHGWGEIHPPDWIHRVLPPAANARLTTAPFALASPGVSGPAMTWTASVTPDFAPSSSSRRLRVRTDQTEFDDRCTNFTTLTAIGVQRLTDHVDVTVSAEPSGGVQARCKGAVVIGWGEYDVFDEVWVDDTLPSGAIPGSDGDTWAWTAEAPGSFTGQIAHRSALASEMHQHYFWGAQSPLTVGRGDTLFAMVCLDEWNPPDEVMLQWLTTSWEHRAFWGEDLIAWGTAGTPSRVAVGPIPASAQWVRLEVAAETVAVVGIPITGMAFTCSGGAALWDYAGVCRGLRIRTDDGGFPIRARE